MLVERRHRRIVLEVQLALPPGQPVHSGVSRALAPQNRSGFLGRASRVKNDLARVERRLIPPTQHGGKKSCLAGGDTRHPHLTAPFFRAALAAMRSGNQFRDAPFHARQVFGRPTQRRRFRLDFAEATHGVLRMRDGLFIHPPGLGIVEVSLPHLGVQPVAHRAFRAHAPRDIARQFRKRLAQCLNRQRAAADAGACDCVRFDQIARRQSLRSSTTRGFVHEFTKFVNMARNLIKLQFIADVFGWPPLPVLDRVAHFASALE